MLISASAFGIYGVKPTGAVDETAPTGDDFLAEVADAWEKSTAPAADAGIRVGLSRFANILDPARAAHWPRCCPSTRPAWAAAWAVASSRFPGWPWTTCVGAIHQGLFDRTLVGPFNVVAPEAVTNAKFNEVLARTLGRPAVAPVPAFALKVAFGELAGALLGGPRVLPARLERAGFPFLLPTLAQALEEMLGAVPLCRRSPRTTDHAGAASTWRLVSDVDVATWRATRWAHVTNVAAMRPVRREPP